MLSVQSQRDADLFLTNRQSLQHCTHDHDAEVPAPRSRAAARPDPRRRQRRCSPSAATTRSRSRTSQACGRCRRAGWCTTTSAAAPRSYIALLQRVGALREERPAAARGAQRARAGGGLRLTLAGLDRGEPHDLSRRRSRPVRTSPTPRCGAWSPASCAERSRWLAAFHADIAPQDSTRLRYALECWTGLNRAATRRWLRGEADPRGDARAACRRLSSTSCARSARVPMPTELLPSAHLLSACRGRR